MACEKKLESTWDNSFFAALNQSKTVILMLNQEERYESFAQSMCCYYSRAGFDVSYPKLDKLFRRNEYTLTQEITYPLMEVGDLQSIYDKACYCISQLRKRYRNIFVMGFGLSATAAWICSAATAVVNGVIGYDGVRIERYKNWIPQCPTLLFFTQNIQAVKEVILSEELNQYEHIEVFTLEKGRTVKEIFNFRLRLLIDDFINSIVLKGLL